MREGALTKKTLVVILAVLAVIIAIEAIVLIAISHKSNPNKESVVSEATQTPEVVPALTPVPMIEPTQVPTSDPTEEPTPEPIPEETETPTNGYKIAIDPGHQLNSDGGQEPIGPGSSTKKDKVSSGTAGVSTGVPEYQLNLDIAKKLKKELKARGYEVYMIRTKNDVRISNIERAQAANDSGADIYIRLHADGSDSHSVHGASALYPTPDNPYVSHLSKKSKKLSQCVIDAYCEKTGIDNRGLSKRDDLTGTNWSEIPVTLLEMGFMSNAAEDELMQDESMQKDMAEGIADGIDNYFGL